MPTKKTRGILTALLPMERCWNKTENKKEGVEEMASDFIAEEQMSPISILTYCSRMTIFSCYHKRRFAITINVISISSS